MPNPEHMRKIEELFDAALAQPSEQRPAWLAAACATEPELQAEVAALLQEHEKSDDFLDRPAFIRPAVTGPVTRSLVGRQFEHYRIMSEIGRGGMGKVYLAHDLRLNRRVAIKLLPTAFTSNPDRVRRFETEARAASSLNHPNIITVYDIGMVDGEHFIATEYIAGETLRDHLNRTLPALRDALEIATQVAGALAAAHEAGVVHRDIKPENIMVRPDGYVKVLDFGLAKLLEKSTGEQRTMAGTGAPTSIMADTAAGQVMGTTSYMSPEQACGQETDCRTDVFSFGVVLYEMIAGCLPFAGNSQAETIAAILDREPPPLARFRPAVPPELSRIVTKSLAKNRQNRYQVIRDLLIDLKNLRLELEVAARLRQTSQADEPVRTAASRAQTTNPDSTSEALQPLDTPSTSPLPAPPASQELLEPVGGAVPLGSRFYIVRSTDEKFRAAIARQDSIVLVKGARQVGKTSLLARGLQQAREAGAKIILTDFQNLSAADLEATERLYLTLAESIADQLDLAVYPDAVWKSGRSPSINFEQYLRREVLHKISAPLVWGLDEVDRLFTCAFGSEVFGLFRSWHNKRALDPSGPWQRLTLAIAYATEAHLFITDLNQSPFNVGTRLQLEDFTFAQVLELNERYGQPLPDKAQVARFYRLVSGHPWLVRRGLHELVANRLDLTALEVVSDHDEGPFGDHLRRLLLSILQDAELSEVVRGLLQGRPCPTPESFYRLRSAGIIMGDSAKEARPRCQLYASWLEKHLL